MQTYSTHRIEPAGVVLVTREGEEVFLSLAEAKRLVVTLRRELGDFHAEHDKNRAQPVQPDKYG